MDFPVSENVRDLFHAGMVNLHTLLYGNDKHQGLLAVTDDLRNPDNQDDAVPYDVLKTSLELLADIDKDYIPNIVAHIQLLQHYSDNLRKALKGTTRRTDRFALRRIYGYVMIELRNYLRVLDAEQKEHEKICKDCFKKEVDLVADAMVREWLTLKDDVVYEDENIIDGVDEE